MFYKGNFVDGEIEGDGILTYYDGRVYRGNFKLGEKVHIIKF
jgi:hypothetical protein